jgi:hypothetical protein
MLGNVEPFAGRAAMVGVAQRGQNASRVVKDPPVLDRAANPRIGEQVVQGIGASPLLGHVETPFLVVQ